MLCLNLLPVPTRFLMMSRRQLTVLHTFSKDSERSFNHLNTSLNSRTTSSTLLDTFTKDSEGFFIYPNLSFTCPDSLHDLF